MSGFIPRITVGNCEDQLTLIYSLRLAKAVVERDSSGIIVYSTMLHGFELDSLLSETVSIEPSEHTCGMQFLQN